MVEINVLVPELHSNKTTENVNGDVDCEETGWSKMVIAPNNKNMGPSYRFY